MIKFDAVGFEEFANELENLASNELAKLERDAVRAGAEIVQRNQQANWNRSDKSGEHIQDNITIGNAREVAEGTASSVGPKGDLIWRAKFVEYGTSYQPPQAPIEQSRIQSEQSATQAMIREFDKGMRL